MHSKDRTYKTNDRHLEQKQAGSNRPTTSSAQSALKAKTVRSLDKWWSEKIEDPKTKRTKLVLGFPTVAGEPRTMSIPAGEREDLKRIRKELLDYDARLPGSPDKDFALIKRLIAQAPATPRVEIDKPGFTPSVKGFVLGKKLIGDAQDKYWWREDSSATALGTRRGKKERWREVGALLAHSSFATLALLAILASPIARYIELRGSSKRSRGQAVSETATFNFVEQSASGKTLAAAIAASATGNPGNRSKWDFTRRGLEEYLESRNEIGAIFDDVEKHIGEHIKLQNALAIVTQYVPEGHSKEISKTAENQGLSRTSWSAFALSSSPSPTDELVKGRTLGQKVRFMDLILPLPSSGGIIDNFPKDADPRQFAKETVQTLEELIAVNYGHLFPAWIDVLLSDDLSDELIQWRDKFVAGVCRQESGYELRFARKFAILYAAGKIAVDRGLLDWPKNWPAQAISKCYHNAIRVLRRDETRVDSAIAKLQQAVAQGRFVLAVNRNRTPNIGDDHYGAICTYKGVRTVAVLDDAFDVLSSGDKFVTKKLLSRLKKAGVYTGGQGHAGTTQIPGPMNINGKRIEKPRFWLFKRAELMTFGKAVRKHETSGPAGTPKRVRIASAKPNTRSSRVGSGSRQVKL
jgi:putative DNA primase/helicase